MELRSKEFDLLKMFAQYLGLVLDRERLLNQVWGYDYFGTRARSMSTSPTCATAWPESTLEIQTVRGSGYNMVVLSRGRLLSDVSNQLARPGTEL